VLIDGHLVLNEKIFYYKALFQPPDIVVSHSSPTGCSGGGRLARLPDIFAPILKKRGWPNGRAAIRCQSRALWGGAGAEQWSRELGLDYGQAETFCMCGQSIFPSQ
jgi:hypothetical protein